MIYPQVQYNSILLKPFNPLFLMLIRLVIIVYFTNKEQGHWMARHKKSPFTKTVKGWKIVNELVYPSAHS